MRSARPKPLHLICGRPMVLHVIHALAAAAPDAHRRRRRPRRRAGHQEGPGAGAGWANVAFVEQAEQRGTGDAAAHRHDRASRRRPRRRRRPSSCCPATRRCCGPRRSTSWSPRTSPTATRRRCSPACSTTRPATAGSSAAPRRAGAAHRRAARRHARRARRSARSSTSIYAFRRDLLGPALRHLIARQRAGRVLPDRRRSACSPAMGHRIGAVQAPGRARPRASTTAGSWRSPSASCAPHQPPLAAQRRHDARPAPDVHRRHRASSAATSRSTRARSCRATRSIGDGCEIGPDTRLVDCVVGAAVPRRAHRRPRRRDRRRRRRRAVRPPAAGIVGRRGRHDRSVLHCTARTDGRHAARREAPDGEGHHQAAGALLRAHAPRAGRGGGRATSASSSATRTSSSSPTARSGPGSPRASAAATCSSCRPTTASTGARSTTRSWSS